MNKVFCMFTLSCMASFSMGAKPAQTERKHPPHPPTPENLVALAFDRFDVDSNYAIDLEELEAVFGELHKNRLGPRPGRESNEDRPPRHEPPPLPRLFKEADLTEDSLLQEQELRQLFEEIERAHRVSREVGRDQPGPPPPEGAPLYKK